MRSRLAKRWIVYSKKSDDLIEQLLINRDVDPRNRDRFLAPDYQRDLHDPFAMKSMREAVNRVATAVQNKEHIAVFGDYDSDGTPGAALLSDFFAKFGQTVRAYIPTRDEGYGLNREAVDLFAREGTTLLITVDCGIKNAVEIAYAKSKGIDTIVCDHHLPPDELPAAIVLNPKQPFDNYPFKELCGTGVAFKLVQALAKEADRFSGLTTEELEKFLKWEMDLVGLATIVDMVPLVGENRVLAKYGLIALQKTRRLGLQKLYSIAGIEPAAIDSYTASFLIGPRLNAAGRMDHASQSYYLLTEQNPVTAEAIAQDLNTLNLKRQAALDKAMREARELVEKEKLYERKVIILDKATWHQGIVGLVAGRLVEEYARPTIIFSRGKIRSKGSARSIDAFHIVEALDYARDVLLKYGGHAQAAGVTIETKHLSALYDKLLEYAEEKLSDKDLLPTLSADAELLLDDIGEDILKITEQFQPHGVGNPRPLFISRDCLVQQVRAVGADGKHLKLTVGGKDAIAFDLGEMSHELTAGDVVDIIYAVERDTWNGRSRLQLKVLDLKKSGTE